MCLPVKNWDDLQNRMAGSTPAYPGAVPGTCAAILHK